MKYEVDEQIFKLIFEFFENAKNIPLPFSSRELFAIKNAFKPILVEKKEEVKEVKEVKKW